MSKLTDEPRRIIWATASPSTELVGYVRTVGGVIFYNDGNTFAQVAVPTFVDMTEVLAAGSASEFGECNLIIGGVEHWCDGVSFTVSSGVISSNTTGFPRHLNDVPNYTLHSSQGAVDAAEPVRSEWLPTEEVKGLVISCWGGSSFKGAYLTVNAPDEATKLARLRSDNTTSTTDTLREFVKAGSSRRLNYSVDVTHVDFVAIDDNTTPDNNIEVRPI